MIKLAIVSPCYNEEAVLLQSTTRLTTLIEELIDKKKIAHSSFILYVNDGSKDNTWAVISQLHQTNKYVKGISLGQNSGHQNAIMAGMMTAKDFSDAIVTLDCDLQDDLTAIEEMIDAYAEGYDVVYGVKKSRQADPLLKRLTAVAFYKLQKQMGVKTIYNHADFRFISRRALEQLSLYQERNLYLRGIIPLLGFPSTTVDDVISERTAGVSKYTLKKMLGLALDGITSFSVKPIHEKRPCMFYTADNMIAARNEDYLYMFSPKTNQEFTYKIENGKLKATPVNSNILSLKSYCFSMLQSAQLLVKQGKTLNHQR